MRSTRRLQAGGRRHLSCPRHGGGARAHRERAGDPDLGDALAGDRASMPSAGATPISSCRSASAAARCRARGRSICGRTSRSAAAGCRRALVEAIADDLEAGRAVAAVSQPARLCAADPVPRLRPPLPVPQLLGLAGRSSLPARAGLPSLRPCRAPAERMPGMPCARQPDRLRAGRRAAGRGGRDAVPAGARRSCCPAIFPAAPSG